MAQYDKGAEALAQIEAVSTQKEPAGAPPSAAAAFTQ